MDEREGAHWQKGPKNNSISTLATHSGQLIQVAEFVVIVKDNTYEILKDKIYGRSEPNEFPLDELPEMLKQRMILSLKNRDNISTDE